MVTKVKTLVICPCAKRCDFPDCLHAKPHEAAEFGDGGDGGTCANRETKCLQYTRRCEEWGSK